MTDDVGTCTPFAIIPVWILEDTRISDRAIRLYGVLYGYVGAKKVAWPLQSTLAKDLNCGLASLKKALKELVDVGAVVRTPRYRENSDSHEIIGCWYKIVSDDPKGVANILANPSQHTGYPLASPLATELDTLELDTSKRNNVATPTEIPTPPPSKLKKTYAPEVYELNNYLCELIDHNGSRVPKGGEVEMDALLRIDKMYPPQVRAVIEWCQSDPFWHINILSAKTLRKQYDKLRLRMKADGVHLPESFSPDLLEQAKAWDEYENDSTMETPKPSFPRPQNSEGKLLDGEGRAYYIDEHDFRRRYLDDE